MPYLGKSPARGLVGTTDIDDLAITSGKLASAVTFGLKSQQVFTSSGTWTKPSGITKVKVYVIGGGGGGGGGDSGPQAGSGGGAGGGAMEIIDVSSVSSVTVTVGAGGSGNSNAAGSNGATSSFGSYCSATGGTGGVHDDKNTLTPAGAGSGGDINIDGQEGGWPDWDGTYIGGYGGNAPFGFGPGGIGGNNIDSGVAPQAGNGYGSGGGGGNSSGGATGGAGAGGIVIVEEYS